MAPEILRETGAQAAKLVRQNLEMARESLRLQSLSHMASGLA